MISLTSVSAAETEALAARLASFLSSGDVVAVRGELGSGKTTFVRGACRALAVDDRVTSPTYTIGHRYRGVVDISHLDLYRFTGLSPAEWGDLEPYFDGAIAFVEWPEAGAGILPEPRVTVTLSHLGPDERSLSVDSSDPVLLQGMSGADPRVRHGD
ncbi:MAG: tRNA (adenosine(37)-N6)-threonylcarbamoyltransferase complex ATPase subunit type 1 TsaE [Gaiella sp.]